jgi:hypothetical protein
MLMGNATYCVYDEVLELLGIFRIGALLRFGRFLWILWCIRIQANSMQYLTYSKFLMAD